MPIKKVPTKQIATKQSNIKAATKAVAKKVSKKTGDNDESGLPLSAVIRKRIQAKKHAFMQMTIFRSSSS
jgi:hypothetical protein